MNTQEKRATDIVTLGFASLVAACALNGAASAAVTVDYDFRQNVNLLNADNVLITATSTVGAVTASRLRGNLDENNAAAWNGGTTGGNALTIDFQTVRNVKTIRMNAQQTGNLIGGAIVETSSDGSTWTPVTGTFSTPAASGTSNESQFVLNSAVDTRYVRVTRNDALLPTATNSWRLNDLRVYGDTGSLAGDRHLDLVSSSAYSSGSVSYARSGFSGEDALGAVLNDNPSSIARQIFYSFGQGTKSTWVELDMQRSVEFRSLGINFVEGYTDANVRFEVHGSNSPNSSGAVTNAPNTDASNNFAGSTLLLNYTGGGLVVGPNYFDLSDFVGRYLRIDFYEPTAPLRFPDLFVYQYAPEPSILAGAALLPLLGRRRRERA